MTDSGASGLAIHATSSQLGLAWGKGSDSEPSRVQTWELGRELSAQLHAKLQAFLAPQTWADLAWLAVARGPGSFTSTRIGLVAARTLAQQLDCPLFAISSLAAFAYSQRSPHPPGCCLAVTLPARRGQLFAACYQFDAGSRAWQVVQPERTLTPEAWAQVRATLPAETVELTAPEALGFTAPAVWTLAQQAYQAGDRPHWSAALPFYGQHPVTEPPH